MNKNIFGSVRTPVKSVDAVNAAGGVAYSLSDKEALANIVTTNCFRGTFYSSEQDLLKLTKDVLAKNNNEFIAKCAVYSHQEAGMKDIPAYLLVYLAGKNKILFERIFDKVVTNAKMLNNVVQVALSGATGQKFNISSKVWKRCIQKWFDCKSPTTIFNGAIGGTPGLDKIIKLAHISANRDKERQELYSFILGKPYKTEYLPEIVRRFELVKSGDRFVSTSGIDFRYLSNCNLTTKQWTDIALNCPWNMLRMNLNNFAKHGIFANEHTLNIISNRLASVQEIEKSMIFPYQLYTAYKNTNELPTAIRSALQQAMETACNNIPEYPNKKIYTFVDISGSMNSPITGSAFGSHTSQVMCNEVAALFACSIMRKNRNSEIIPFHTQVVLNTDINSFDSIATNTNKIYSLPSGGTACGCTVEYLNNNNLKADLVIVISDNESWADSDYTSSRLKTGLMHQWDMFKKNNPHAKLVCLDLTPKANSQVTSRSDVLYVGGFSDSVFTTIKSFVSGEKNSWIKIIENYLTF